MAELDVSRFNLAHGEQFSLIIKVPDDTKAIFVKGNGGSIVVAADLSAGKKSLNFGEKKFEYDVPARMVLAHYDRGVFQIVGARSMERDPSHEEMVRARPFPFLFKNDFVDEGGDIGVGGTRGLKKIDELLWSSVEVPNVERHRCKSAKRHNFASCAKDTDRVHKHEHQRGLCACGRPTPDQKRRHRCRNCGNVILNEEERETKLEISNRLIDKLKQICICCLKHEGQLVLQCSCACDCACCVNACRCPCECDFCEAFKEQLSKYKNTREWEDETATVASPPFISRSDEGITGIYFSDNEDLLNALPNARRIFGYIVGLVYEERDDHIQVKFPGTEIKLRKQDPTILH